MIVADASVILKWVLRGEVGAAAAAAVRERHVEGVDPIAVPVLFFYEAANALAVTRRLSEEEALEGWEALVQTGLRSYSPGLGEAQRAIRLARSAGISGYAAAYIALAEALQCDFVTADTKLVNKLKEEKLHCVVRLLPQG